MATYNYNGQTFSAPDDMPQEEVMRLLEGSEQAQPEVANQTPAEPQQKVEESSLQFNKDWVGASRILYNSENPSVEKQPTDSEVAEYAADKMDWMENTFAFAVDANRLRSATPEQNKAFVYLMDTYPNVKWSRRSVLNTAAALVTDPLNLPILASLGIGTAPTQAAKFMSKQALKQMLRAGIVSGVENGVIGTATETMRQGIRVDAGTQESTDWGQVGKAGAISTAAGFVLGGAVDGAATAIKGKFGKGAAEAPKASTEAPRLIDTPEAPTPAREATTPVSEAPVGAAEAPAVEAPRVEPVADGPKVVDGVVDEVPPPKAGEQIELPLGDTPAPKVEAEPTVKTVTPEPPRSNPIIEALQTVNKDTGFRIFSTERTAMKADAQAAIDIVEKFDPVQLKQAVEEARRTAVEPEVKHALDTTLRESTENLFQRVAELEKAGDTAGRDKALEMLEAVRPADLDMSSGAGATLGARGGNVNTNEFRGRGVTEILREKGIDPERARPEQVKDARDQFSKEIVKRIDDMKHDTEISKLKQAEEEAMAANDSGKAAEIGMERNALMEAKVNADPDPVSKQIGQAALTAQRGAVEVVISNVFSPKTVLINLISTGFKMAYRGVAWHVLNAGSKQALRQSAVFYSVMAASQSAALRAAKATWRYERGLLTGDMAKIFEDNRGPVIPRWLGGHIIRTFPRLIAATDEYMTHVLYKAHAGAETYAHLYETALDKGLSDVEADKFAKLNLDNFLEDSLIPQKSSDSIDALYQLGIQRGLKGGALKEFIKTEIDKNGDLFQVPKSVSSLNFAKDMLFQRQFSGDGFSSSLAKGFEAGVNKFPIMRLMGQLFVRTPIRVFEESARLTPGLNLFAPHFLRDLAGKGPGREGGVAHIRAQSEAFLSIALGSAVMAMYARGMVTGGGGVGENWRQKKSLTNGGYEPYTMYFGDPNNKDTYKFNFRNYDPISGPFKIMANAMDAFNMLQTRIAQGEYVDATAEKMIVAQVAAGGFALVNAFKDAALTEGLSEIYDLVSDVQDPEHNQDKLLRYFAQKAQMLIPSTVTKVQQLQGGPNNDPATFAQFLLAKINPNATTLPKQYDALGYAIKDPNPMAQLTGIDLRVGGKGKSTGDAKRDEIGKALNEITVLTGKHFTPPSDAGPWAPEAMKAWKGTDLRTVMTKDGKETYYDRLQKYLGETGVKDMIYGITKLPLPIGVPSVAASQAKGNEIQQKLTAFRQQAFVRLMFEESGIMEKSNKATIEQMKASMGLRDVQIAPYK